jgi:hypothetical protein
MPVRRDKNCEAWRSEERRHELPGRRCARGSSHDPWMGGHAQKLIENAPGRAPGIRPRALALAARNARRHGLSISVWSDPDRSAEVEALAHELAGPAAGPELLYRARGVATAQLDVDRVCRARHRLIAREFADPAPHPKTARAEKQYVEDLICPDERLSQGPPWRLR